MFIFILVHSVRIEYERLHGEETWTGFLRMSKITYSRKEAPWREGNSIEMGLVLKG